ncbi:ATP-binding protein [Streptomyces sp. NPDC051940]|uniref:ATP-binding protein n=1 Tax=Streptomyces sp. NPDC051940 TaxID=3155675 RepID=UPI0034210E9C
MDSDLSPRPREDPGYESPDAHCTVEVEAVPSRIGQIRRIVIAQLRYWHLDALVEPAALAVTELLANVHQHAGPDKRCTIELEQRPGRLTVSVRDRSQRLPLVGSPDPLDSHGRGLPLVAALSEQWGCTRREDGKAVWFTLAAPVTAEALPRAARTRRGAARSA